MSFAMRRWPLMPERVKRLLASELAFFRDVPMLAPTPEKEISVMVGGGGGQLFVQTVHWPHRSRQEQELESANTLLRAAQMMAVSAGAVLVQHAPASPPPPAAPPQEGAPNG